ncbi:MAG: putative aldehyde dehydrogenase [Hydrocarboniphaga sp.]|uniref:aldehyde dehydrogenase family protein n=1 Tax=Hydrocarboniphaga sp. TaxID=2033016 RepID=UPI002630CC37|nr:aldehyde dehydrogenase family protein [Hydrocarboniphaga sp.]MDB5971424.1 putative aldehyde dehydrogenase [Hydrocarboniphaga sp.]
MGIPYTHIDKLFIDGAWVASSERAREPVINPATEEVIAEAPIGGRAEAEAAIAAARHSFDHGPWSQMSMQQRAEVMRRFRDALVENGDRIKALLTAEAGATFGIMNGPQFGGAIRALDFAIEQGLRMKPEMTPVEIRPNPYDPRGNDMIGAASVEHEPFGVVVGITAYNYPFFLSLGKIAPALMAGNSIVLKPSPFTPYSTLLFGEIAQSVGIPKGVLNIVTGGPEVGSMLTTDPRVDLISFTGSDAVGAAIMGQAAPTLKKLHLELGGKSALIVRADADVQASAMLALMCFTMHSGQGCALLTRYIVHNSVRAAFVATIKGALAHWKQGDPSDPSVLMGPLIRAAARAKTERYVQIGLDSGAKLIVGGKRPAHLQRGYFFEPTLFDDVDNRSALAQDEIFGPVGAVIGYDTDEQAIALANDSPLGLYGAVNSADKAQAFRMARRLRTGNVWINGGLNDLTVEVPFGGYKRSGIGREFGSRWLAEYMQEKAIVYPIG